MLFSKLGHLFLHLFDILLVCKIFLLLWNLHGEETTNFYVFNYTTWNIILVLWKLLYKFL